jgi:hypothetical protein
VVVVEGEKSRERVHIVLILCAQVRKWENETIPGMGRGRIKENDGESKFNYDIFDIL